MSNIQHSGKLDKNYHIQHDSAQGPPSRWQLIPLCTPASNMLRFPDESTCKEASDVTRCKKCGVSASAKVRLRKTAQEISSSNQTCDKLCLVCNVHRTPI
eukprot:2453712-Amphidinium_carterae.1